MKYKCRFTLLNGDFLWKKYNSILKKQHVPSSRHEAISSLTLTQFGTCCGISHGILFVFEINKCRESDILFWIFRYGFIYPIIQSTYRIYLIEPRNRIQVDLIYNANRPITLWCRIIGVWCIARQYWFYYHTAQSFIQLIPIIQIVNRKCQAADKPSSSSRSSSRNCCCGFSSYIFSVLMILSIKNHLPNHSKLADQTVLIIIIYNNFSLQMPRLISTRIFVP